MKQRRTSVRTRRNKNSINSHQLKKVDKVRTLPRNKNNIKQQCKQAGHDRTLQRKIANHKTKKIHKRKNIKNRGQSILMQETKQQKQLIRRPRINYRQLTKQYVVVKKVKRSRALTKQIKQGKVKQQTFKKQINLNNILAPIYIACDQDLNILASKNEKIQVKIASITKLMNLMTCLQIIQKYKIPFETIIQVPKLSVRRTQTNAGLRQGDKLTLNDLIYAMLLPSGGDAAQAIAVGLGKYLTRKKDILEYRKAYINRMNEFAKQIQMNETSFLDERGYCSNISTAFQIVKLLSKLSKNQTALNFLKVGRHKTTALSKLNILKLFVWNSTNLLLSKGFFGKTGTTTGYKNAFAGIKFLDGKKYYFCILQHLSYTGRFTDVDQIFKKVIKNA